MKKIDEESLTSHSAYIYTIEDSKKARKKLEPVVCCVLVYIYGVRLHMTFIYMYHEK